MAAVAGTGRSRRSQSSQSSSVVGGHEETWGEWRKVSRLFWPRLLQGKECSTLVNEE